MSACGDHPGHILDSNFASWPNNLGNINLQDGQSYKSCRSLCKEKYPDFDIYQKFNSYTRCECRVWVSGDEIKLRKHGAYTFGYANECGKYSASLYAKTRYLVKIQESFIKMVCNW